MNDLLNNLLQIAPGPSPAQASDAPAPVPVPFITEPPSEPTSESTLANTHDPSIIANQPVVRLDRLSLEDQVLMQKSLSKFAENRPQLASQLGITPTAQSAMSSDSEDEKPKGRAKKDKKFIAADEDYVPDTFTALVGRKRKTVNSKEEKTPEIIRKAFHLILC